MPQYSPISGTITSISPFTAGAPQSGCVLEFSLMNQDMGPVTLIVTPNTFVDDQERLKPGDAITAFYDTMAPMPLIYPPRYQALIIAETDNELFAFFDYFNEELVNTDMTLKLNVPEQNKTEIVMSNGQTYYGNPGGHWLLVFYSTTTRSIPAMTTPEKIVVFCTEQ